MMKLSPPLSWFYDAWMEFSRVLGMIMSKIILTILWLVGFGTYAVILKIIRLFVPKAQAPGTSWFDVPAAVPDDLHRQF